MAAPNACNTVRSSEKGGEQSQFSIYNFVKSGACFLVAFEFVINFYGLHLAKR